MDIKKLVHIFKKLGEKILLFKANDRKLLSKMAFLLRLNKQR